MNEKSGLSHSPDDRVQIEYIAESSQVVTSTRIDVNKGGCVRQGLAGGNQQGGRNWLTPGNVKIAVLCCGTFLGWTLILLVLFWFLDLRDFDPVCDFFSDGLIKGNQELLIRELCGTAPAND